MAIGGTPPGGPGSSAAARFRPRGTAPGLRRSLAQEDERQEQQSNEQEQWEQPNETSDTTTQAASEPASTAASATTEHAAPLRQQPLRGEVVHAATKYEPPVTGSTSTDPSPSTGDTSSAPKRGRPRGSTRSDASPRSQPATDTGVLSVSAARARMREIEQEMKSLRGQLAGEISALQKTFAEREAPLREEYRRMGDAVLGE